MPMRRDLPISATTISAWIAQAKRQETRDRRIAQMLTELASGDVYMKMKWSGSAGTRQT